RRVKADLERIHLPATCIKEVLAGQRGITSLLNNAMRSSGLNRWEPADGMDESEALQSVARTCPAIAHLDKERSIIVGKGNAVLFLNRFDLCRRELRANSVPVCVDSEEKTLWIGGPQLFKLVENSLIWRRHRLIAKSHFRNGGRRPA